MVEENNQMQAENNPQQPIQENSQTPYESSYEYGGFWIRFLAVFLDGLIVGLPMSIIFGAISLSIGTNISYIGSLLMVVYIIYFEGTTGQTLGKKIVGVKVIGYDGNTIGIPMAILRYIGKIVSTIILMIGYIMAAFDSKKQALHDRIAKTYVIKVK